MEILSPTQLKEFLDEKHDLYNRPSFIENDPIQIPHMFTKKEDIEISGFLASIIAWGRRNMIIKNGTQWMDLMDNNPHEFILNASKSDLHRFESFVHRTFNGVDCIFFVESLMNIYRNHGGLEDVVSNAYLKNEDIKESLATLREVFFTVNHEYRSEKHIANVNKNSAAKRLNLFLMWMVRNDNRGVHFGLWNNINPKNLLLPLDVHTANVGRKLGLIKRNPNNWITVEEITAELRKLDPHDPIKYDFALFGLGIIEGF